jgi:hypothetical protein
MHLTLIATGWEDKAELQKTIYLTRPGLTFQLFKRNSSIYGSTAIILDQLHSI